VEYGKKSEKKCIFPILFHCRIYILVSKEIHYMTKRLSTSILTALTIAVTAVLNACYCEDCTDTCSDVTHDKWDLFDFQKEKNFFGQAKSAHYSHSDGFEVDMKRSKDSTYKEKHSDFCYESTEEMRLLRYTSTDPVMDIEILLYETHNEGYVNISFADNDFSFIADSNGNISDDIEMLDTARFNGTLYDSVYVIPGFKFITREQHRFEMDIQDSGALAFISKTKGILSIQTTDGDTLTLMEKSGKHKE